MSILFAVATPITSWKRSSRASPSRCTMRPGSCERTFRRQRGPCDRYRRRTEGAREAHHACGRGRRAVIAIVDYGLGNLASVRNAFRRVGAEVIVTADGGALERADGVVLPGVGSAAAGMDH